MRGGPRGRFRAGGGSRLPRQSIVRPVRDRADGVGVASTFLRPPPLPDEANYSEVLSPPPPPPRDDDAVVAAGDDDVVVGPPLPPSMM